MDALVKILPNFKKFNSYIADVKNKINPIMLSGLTDSGKVHFAYATRFYSDNPICIITYNEMQAKKLMKDLSFYGDKVLYFPKREILNFDYIAGSKESLYQRIESLNSIYNNKAQVIVTTIEAVSQKMISKEKLYNNILKLEVSDTCDLNELKEKLVNLGYERYDLVEARGAFSVRGGIVDVAITDKKGIRIEFWGDEIDRISEFDISIYQHKDLLI